MKNKALSFLLSVGSLLALYSFQNIKETFLTDQTALSYDQTLEKFLTTPTALSYDQTFENVEAIDLEILTGSVKLVPSNSKKLRVKGVYDEDDFLVKVEQSGSRLKIFEKNKKNATYTSSSWELEMPAGLILKGNLISGDLSVKGVEAEIDGQAASGNVSIEDYRGNISWRTGSGRLKMNKSTGRITFQTGSGNITAQDYEGKGQFNTGSGDISIHRSIGGFSANTGSGNVEGTDLEITSGSSFNSGSGNASVVLGDVTQGDVSVASGSGNASVDFDGHSFSGVLTMKCNKRDGSIKAPFSFDKEMEEEAQIRRSQRKLVKIKRFGNEGVNIQVLTGSGKAVVQE
ncbi:MAG: DUF4097 family beta strand repeat-containing protein [Saprospiraceae bacterium]|nr:DUF4097 family beta strand repeat protein [Lewinella sp.]